MTSEYISKQPYQIHFQFDNWCFSCALLWCNRPVANTIKNMCFQTSSWLPQSWRHFGRIPSASFSQGHLKQGEVIGFTWNGIQAWSAERPLASWAWRPEMLVFQKEILLVFGPLKNIQKTLFRGWTYTHKIRYSKEWHPGVIYKNNCNQKHKHTHTHKVTCDSSRDCQFQETKQRNLATLPHGNGTFILQFGPLGYCL